MCSLAGPVALGVVSPQKSCVMPELSLTGDYFPSEIPILWENLPVQFPLLVNHPQSTSLWPQHLVLQKRGRFCSRARRYIWIVTCEGASFCYVALSIYTVVWVEMSPDVFVCLVLLQAVEDRNC